MTAQHPAIRKYPPLPDEVTTLYHGTTTARLAAIRRQGLIKHRWVNAIYATPWRDVALDYAAKRAIESRRQAVGWSQPVLVTITINPLHGWTQTRRWHYVEYHTIQRIPPADLTFEVLKLTRGLTIAEPV